MSRVAVVGGGAAGMMAAVAAAECGHEVMLLEKNEKLGKKIYITGKGRCNLTNNCGVEELLAAVCVNRKFLYRAFYGFSSQDTVRFFEESGMAVKTERGNRVFPVSDHASDVSAALERRMRRDGVRIRLGTEVKEILTEPVEEAELPSPEKGQGSGRQTADAWESQAGQGSGRQTADAWESQAGQGSGRQTADAGESQAGQGSGRQTADAGESQAGQEGGRRTADAGGSQAGPRGKGGRDASGSPRCRVAGVRLAGNRICRADAVIVATGGLSYRTTGSTGDGYRFAEALGHRVTDLSPSLVPMETAEDWAERLQGLSLRNVEVSILDGKKVLFREFGEMLFTHYGVTGPLILTASSAVQRKLSEHPLDLYIDLKPALSPEQLDARLLREFEAAKKKQFKNALHGLYPAKLIPVMVERSGIPEEKAVHDLSRAERRGLVELTKHFPLTLTGLRDYNEAVITRGGVSVQEIDPSTMESRKVRGLHFAGEVLDLDAVTGGFNLQIAWSTGQAAGRGVRQQ